MHYRPVCHVSQAMRESTRGSTTDSACLSARLRSGSLTTTHSARNLGFIFDEHLTFSDQISALYKSCYYHIRQLSCIRPYLDFKTASTKNGTLGDTTKDQRSPARPPPLCTRVLAVRINYSTNYSNYMAPDIVCWKASINAAIGLLSFFLSFLSLHRSQQPPMQKRAVKCIPEVHRR